MNHVFISYADGDKSLSSLLVALLEYHYIDTWQPDESLRSGDDLPQETLDALGRSSALVVMLSEQAHASGFVERTVAAFREQGGTRPVIAARLDSVSPSRFAGIEAHAVIDCRESLLTGFQSLFHALGREFLPSQERTGEEDPVERVGRRFVGDRRDIEDRRKLADSRQGGNDRRGPERRLPANLPRRLRKAFWDSYSAHAGVGKFEEIELNMTNLHKLIEALRSVVIKYVFVDRDGNRERSSVSCLETVSYAVWERAKKRQVPGKPIYIAEEVANEIYAHYDVRMASKRSDRAGRRAEDRRVWEAGG